MSGDRPFILSINSRVAVGAALGVGLVAGAGTAYLVSRLHDHTRLTHQISSLHATIMEVKRDIALLETGLSHKEVVGEEEEEEEQEFYKRNRSSPSPSSPSSRFSSRPSSRSSFRKKTVSFSSIMSAITTASYNTAQGYETDASFQTALGYDTDASHATDTDYFSPDEDDDEFFDLMPEESERAMVHIEAFPDDSNKKLALPVEGGGLLVEGGGADETELGLLLHQVDQLSDGFADQQTQAFHLLHSHLQMYPDNAEFLWRLAKATRNMAAIAEKSGNLKEKESLVFQAYSQAERALELSPENAEVHKWFGILSGMRGEYLGIGERVRSGSVFKEHIDRALALKPNDATLHHLLGRFCYEVSQISWLERKAAAAIFGTVPSSTFEEAQAHFQAAEDLQPTGWKENRLFLAKCHLQLEHFDTMAEWLEKAKAAPLVTPDDEIVHREVLELHHKYA